MCSRRRRLTTEHGGVSARELRERGGPHPERLVRAEAHLRFGAFQTLACLFIESVGKIRRDASFQQSLPSFFYRDVDILPRLPRLPPQPLRHLPPLQGLH